MRRRITRTLVATAAAGATITTLGFTAMGAAGASTHGGKTFAPSAPVVATNANCTITGTGVGLPSDNCGMAGYEAGNRDFRYAQALITVPTAHGDGSVNPQMYVALDSSTSDNYNFVRAGVSPCLTVTDGILPACGTSTTGWVAYVEALRAGAAPVFFTSPISTAALGDGVFASLYREPSGNTVNAVLKVPALGGGTHTFNFSVTFLGAVFTEAEALTDWTSTHGEGTATAPILALVKTRQAQFFQGAFTTSTGQRGTFKGPWTLIAPEATSNANLPPLGTLIAEPSFLWNDGMGNGFGDAFGVWRGPF